MEKKSMKEIYGSILRPSLWLMVILIQTVLSIPCPAQLKYPVNGFVSSDYRWRQTDDDDYGDATDQDLYGYLSLDFGDPQISPVSGYIFGRLSYDLDGEQDQDEFYPFAEITDSYDNPNERLYIAYIDLNKIPYLEKISLGRQFIYDTPVWLYLDGVRVESKEFTQVFSLKLGGYGGVPAHLYESDQDGNAMYGAFIQFKPWLGNRLKFDWAHAEGEYLYGDETNDYYSAEIWQAIKEFQLYAGWARLEDEDHSAQARATFYKPEWDLLIQASYYELLEKQKDLAIEFDPFYASLRTLHPYWQMQFLVSKGIGKHFSIEAGWDERQLKEEDDESEFNHSFTRYYVTLALWDLFEHLDMSATGEIWDTGNDERIETYGGDLTYKFNKDFRLSVGTYYDLYKYEYFLDEEKDKVQSYYTRLSYLPIKGLGAVLDYEFDNTEFGDYQVLRVEARYAF